MILNSEGRGEVECLAPCKAGPVAPQRAFFREFPELFFPSQGSGEKHREIREGGGRHGYRAEGIGN